MKALVLGGAATLWRDVAGALDLGRFDLVVACNDAAAVWPGRLDAAVSLHPEKYGIWMGRRNKAGHPAPGRLVGHLEAGKSTVRLPDLPIEFAEWKFEGQPDSGSSGLFALRYALESLGADRAVLCGVPMHDAAAHFFDATPWGAAAAHRRGFNQARPAIGDRARSMSGWSADLLGQPTKEWLAG